MGFEEAFVTNADQDQVMQRMLGVLDELYDRDSFPSIVACGQKFAIRAKAEFLTVRKELLAI